MTALQTPDFQDRTITAFFDDRASADTAIADVVAAGIPRTQITVTGSGTSTGVATDNDRGFWESLKDLFLPEEDRYAYAEGLRRGGYVVSVRTDQGSYDRIIDILDRDGAVDLDEREANWRNEGWQGFSGTSGSGAGLTGTSGLSSSTGAASTAGSSYASTAGLSAGAATATTAGTIAADTTRSRATAVGTSQSTAASATGRTDEVIPVVEERLRVGKRDVNHGRVRIRSYVVETPVNEQVSLREEQVQIERRPVDRPVSAADNLFQDRVIEAEERVEEAVIAKEARVTEEISLRKTAEQRNQTVSDTVRHTEVEVQDDRGTVGTTGRAAGLAGTAGLSGTAGTAGASGIVEHMDVLGSDGVKIGTVDHLDGPDRIKLAKNTSPDGQHHYVPLAWVERVDAHVHLRRTSAEARAAW